MDKRPAAAFLLAATLASAGCTPALVVKAQNGDLAGTKLLLSKPIEQETKDEALVETVTARHDAVMALLLDNGASPEAKNEFGASILSLAVVRSDTEAVKIILAHKAKMDTAIAALENAGPLIAQIFLDNGLDPNARDPKGSTPLAHAACSGQADIVKFWLDHGTDPWTSGKACERSHFDVDSVAMVCDSVGTALDCAKSKGYDKIVALLEAAMKKP